MKGARPLTDSEITLILDKGFTGQYALRNSVLFLLRVKTGLRISEALSIKIADILDGDNIADRVYIHRKNTKGKIEGRSIVLHPQVKSQLNIFLSSLPPTQEYLFESRKGGMLDKKSAWRLDQQACKRVGIDPNRISTHSTRKTFAGRVYDKLGGDIFKTQKALGHKDINSTVKYLAVDEKEIDDAILSI
jgi:integrase